MEERSGCDDHFQKNRLLGVQLGEGRSALNRSELTPWQSHMEESVRRINDGLSLLLERVDQTGGGGRGARSLPEQQRQMGSIFDFVQDDDQPHQQQAPMPWSFPWVQASNESSTEAPSATPSSQAPDRRISADEMVLSMTGGFEQQEAIPKVEPPAKPRRPSTIDERLQRQERERKQQRLEQRQSQRLAQEEEERSNEAFSA